MTKIANHILKGQSAIEVALAIALGVVIVIGASGIWAWLQKTMGEQFDWYRATRMAAIHKRSDFLFGSQPPFVRPELAISTMNYAIGAPPSAVEPVASSTCAGIRDEALDQTDDLHASFVALESQIITDYDTPIALIKDELRDVSVKMYSYGVFQGEKGLEQWLFPLSVGAPGDVGDCDTSSYLQELGEYQGCLDACGSYPDPGDPDFAEEAKAWSECGLTCGEMPQAPDCYSGSPGFNPDDSFDSKTFDEIENKFDAKYPPSLPYEVKFFVNGEEVGSGYILGKIANGRELENERQQKAEQARNILDDIESIERPIWQAYYNCLEQESPECMDECRNLADEAQNLRAAAFAVFRQTFSFFDFRNKYDYEANQAQQRFIACFDPCRVSEGNR